MTDDRGKGTGGGGRLIIMRKMAMVKGLRLQLGGERKAAISEDFLATS